MLVRCSKRKTKGGGECSNESGDDTDTSATGDEQSFDEELYVGSRLLRADVWQRPQLEQGENRVGGMCFALCFVLLW